LIFSPTPIVGPDRAGKKDNHANEVFAFEGNELRSELSKHDGAVVFCGDRHWQYASVDEKHGLWEFGCGPGSEKHQLGWKKGDRRPIHRFLRVAGGFLSGELSYQDEEREHPQLAIRHHKVSGAEVSRFVFPQPTIDAPTTSNGQRTE
jgi:alkaline phosphatase D